MDPLLGESLRLGRRALEEVPEFHLLEDFRWYEAAEQWALKCRLTVRVRPGGPVPEVTDWYLLATPAYPGGSIGLYPAKEGGLVATFPHQAFNGEGRKDWPWRVGKLCLESDVAVLRRQGLDQEPRTAETRLVWHVRRAVDWLSLASRDKLLKEGDYFEFPAYPSALSGLVAFSESQASLGSWLASVDRSGFVKLDRVPAAKPLWVVRSFEAADGREILSPPWGSKIESTARPAPLGAWVLVDQTVALCPWQAPVTWGELRSQLSGQGIDLGALLDRLSPRLRDHDLPLERRPNHLLLLGFPIPNKVGGPNVRLHWLALQLPPLSAGSKFARGFRKDEQGYRQRDAGLLRDDERVRWISTECWDRDELSGRGRLGPGLRGRSVALLGAGALGSALGELLVRGGVEDLTIFDAESFEAGNLVRHTLLLGQIGAQKAIALVSRLDGASPWARINGGRAFPDALVDCEPMDLVLDATGSDDVLVQIAKYPWVRDRWFVSAWVGMHARRIYCFSCRGSSFPRETLHELFRPWGDREAADYSGEEPPRPGIGCWNPVFPARADDIWLAASILMKHIDHLLEGGPEAPALAVYEQSVAPDDFGIRRVQ